MSLSSTFERTDDRLEIGRYDRTSEESRSTFLRRGEMYAALKTAGTQPVVSERLNISVKKGAKTSMTDLSVGVGSGSKAQLLSGSTRTAATTSSTVTGSKQVKWTSDDDVVKDGGDIEFKIHWK